ncbi:MAG: hypothetical protein HYX41_06425 [Bdellovibrio sp.]|nr:hypothetical protein [Bdellovibrio sp.]
MFNKFTLLVSMLVVSLVLNCQEAVASPSDALQLAKALIQSRIKYREGLRDYFSADPISREDQDEKYLVLSDLSGGLVFKNFDPQGIPTYLYISSEGLEVRRYYLKDFAESQTKDIRKYQSWLTGLFEGVPNPYETKLDAILAEAAEVTPPSDETLAQFQVARLYLKVWEDLQNLKWLRDRKNPARDARRLENGYSDALFLRQLLMILAPETGGFMRCLKEYRADRVDSDSYVVHTPYLQAQMVTIQKTAAFLDGVTLNARGVPEELVSRLQKLRPTINKMSLLYNRLMNLRAEGIKMEAQVRSAMEKLILPEARQKFEERVAQLADFNSAIFTLKSYPFMAEFLKSLLEAEKCTLEISRLKKEEEKRLRAESRKKTRKGKMGLSLNQEKPKPIAHLPDASTDRTLDFTEVQSNSPDPSVPEPVLEQRPIENEIMAAEPSYEEEVGDVEIIRHHYFKKLRAPEKEKERSDIKELKEAFSHRKYEQLLLQFFDDENNDGTLTFEEIYKLVKRVGGTIVQRGTSHCTVIVPGGISHSWRPHGAKGGHSKKLGAGAVRLFRAAFEMAGITPAVVFARE